MLQKSKIFKIVLDVGEKQDPELKCFDHHQDGMDEECTLSVYITSIYC